MILPTTTRWPRVLRTILFFIWAASLLISLAAPQSNASAAPTLTVTPLTWNVVGLDSNNVNVGPSLFPVGARVCSQGGTASGVDVSFVWDDGKNPYNGDPYINLRGGSKSVFEIASLEDGHCQDIYFEAVVTRSKSAYTMARAYHITAQSAGGAYASTPTPRELFVEYLVSQNRNYTSGIAYGLYNAAYADPASVPAAALTNVSAGGNISLNVGGRYYIRLYAKTAIGGYNQLESFLTLSNTYFQINKVSTSYTQIDPHVGSPSSLLYADSCGWDNNPASPTYRSCIEDDGKAGNQMTVTYDLTILSGAGSTLSMNSLIYDFSGSSYHYNSDYSTSGVSISLSNPVTFSKAFAPQQINSGGTSRLTFTIANPGAASVSQISFSDNLPTTPSAMVVAPLPNLSTAGCGTPTITAAAGTGLISASDIVIAAGGACEISIDVTASSNGIYVNTTEDLLIGGVRTGLTASAPLAVAIGVVASGCSAPGTLALWHFPSGFNISAPLVSQKSVSTATAGVGSGLTPKEFASDNSGISGSASWGTNGGVSNKTTTLNTADNDYFEFKVNTQNFSSVTFSFSTYGITSGPKNWAVYHFAEGGVLPASATQTGTAPNGWTASGNITINSGLNPTGNTVFRIYLYNSLTATIGSDLYLDDVRFTGCTEIPPDIAKGFSPASIAVGETSTLTFTLSNANDYDLTQAAFTDLFPEGMSVADPLSAQTTCADGTFGEMSAGDSAVIFSGGTIPAGSSCTASVLVSASTPGSLVNTSGKISAYETGIGGSATANLAVYQQPSFSKSFSPAPVYTGEKSTLTFTLTNANSVDITGAAFNDVLPGGMVVASPAGASTSACGSPVWAPQAGAASVSFIGGTIPAGGSCVVSVQVMAADAGDYTNTTGTLSGAIAGVSLSAPQTSAQISVLERSPSLTLTKQVSTSSSGPWNSSTSVPAGGDVFYRLIVENTGDVDLSNVQVSDPQVDLSACPLSAPFTLRTVDPVKMCIVGPYAAGDGETLNTASASAAYNGKSYTVTATARYNGAGIMGGEVVLQKRVSASSSGPWSTELAGIQPGSSVFYKLVVENNSAATIYNAVVTDPQVDVSSCIFSGAIEPGAAEECIVGPIEAQEGVHPNVAGLAYIDNSVPKSSTSNPAVYSAGGLTIGGSAWIDNNTDGVIDTGEAGIGSATIELYQDANGNGVVDAEDLLLDIAVTSADGSYAFTNIPGGSLYLVRVKSGTSNYHYISGKAWPDEIIPIAALSGNSDNNNFGYENILPPDLIITKSDNTSGNATVGLPFEWSIAVANLGPSSATFGASQVILRDALPTGPVYSEPSLSTSGGVTGNIACTIAIGMLECAASGENVTIPAGGQMVVLIEATAADAGTLINQARVDPDGAVIEQSENNNYSTASVVGVYNALPDLTLQKSNNTAGKGVLSKPFTWTLKVQNIGYGGAQFLPGEMILRDVLPPGPEYGAVSTGNFLNIANSGAVSCAVQAGTLSCSASGAPVTIGAGGSFTVSLSVLPAQIAVLANSADVDPDNAVDEDSESNNNDLDAVSVIEGPSLSLTKTDGAESVEPGSTTVYTLTVYNQGGIATAGEIKVIDILPAGLFMEDGAFTPGGANGEDWSCQASSGVITCSSGAPILPGATSAFTLQATVDMTASGTLFNRAQVGGGGDPLLPEPIPAAVKSCSENGSPSQGCAVDRNSTASIPPTPTNTLEPTPTNTLEPTPTNTLEPTPTNTLEPTATNTLTPTPTNTLEPTATNTLVPTATNTPLPTGLLSVYLFEDANSDGSRQTGETIIAASVRIEVRDQTGKVIAAMNTTSGIAVFSGIPIGDYVIVKTAPIAGYLETTSSSLPATLLAGTTESVYFGHHRIPAGTYQLDGYVWHDENRDGVRDSSEAGLVRNITLRNANGDPLNTTQSNSSGYFVFTSLNAGIYAVTEDNDNTYPFSSTIDYKFTIVGPSNAGVAQSETKGSAKFASLAAGQWASMLAASSSQSLVFGDYARSASCTNPSADPILDTSAGAYPSSVYPASPYFMQFQVGNQGDSDANNVVVSVPLPASLNVTAVNIHHHGYTAPEVDNGYTLSISGKSVLINFKKITSNDVYNVLISTTVDASAAPDQTRITATITSYDMVPGSSSCGNLPDNDKGAFILNVTGTYLDAPETGFAPNRVTRLPEQKESEMYADLNDVRLVIPSLKIRTPIVGVPLKDDWNVDWLVYQAGWLEGTAYMGTAGNSVVVGHNVLPSGSPGPFQKLDQMKVGDYLFVDQGGKRLVYKVSHATEVAPDHPIIYRHETSSWITLVTCSDFDEESQMYRKRVVVKAYLVSTIKAP